MCVPADSLRRFPVGSWRVCFFYFLGQWSFESARFRGRKVGQEDRERESLVRDSLWLWALVRCQRTCRVLLLLLLLLLLFVLVVLLCAEDCLREVVAKSKTVKGRNQVARRTFPPQTAQNFAHFPLTNEMGNFFPPTQTRSSLFRATQRAPFPRIGPNWPKLAQLSSPQAAEHKLP